MVIVSAAAALLGALPLAALAGGTPKTDTQIGQRMADKSARGFCTMIAKIDGALTPAQTAQMAALGADITRHLGFIHSVALTLPSRNLSKLAALPFVSHLSYDGEVKKCDEFTMGGTGADVAYSTYGFDGTGVTVAVVDSGIAAKSKDLKNQIVDAVSFVPYDGSTDDACGHGTHIAGIIGGNGGASSDKNCFKTFYGVARNVGEVNVRVLDANGQGSVSSVLAGIQWVINNKDNDRISVLNLSLGHPVGESYTTDPLCQAVERAWKAGIVVVCAAGNNGRMNTASTAGTANEGWGTAYGSIQSPANDPYVITVGAAKQAVKTNGNGRGDGGRKNATDLIATYSSRGPSRLDLILKPDIIAPGNRVISVVAHNSALFYYDGGTNQIPLSFYSNKGHVDDPSNAYFRLSGTSMAAPVVAGAAALMLQKDPTLTPDTIKARLMVSADKWLDSNGSPDPCTYGAGYLDIPEALESTVTTTRYALSPQLTLTTGGDVLINTSLTIYGSKALSGVSTVWGSKAISGVKTLYGSKAISGINTIAASKAVSGVTTIYSSSVWADKTLSGSSSTAVDLTSVALSGE